MIGVVDYDAGNLKSVETALHHLGASFRVSSHPEELLKSDKLIFPGVGNAGSAMETLNKTGLGEMLKDFAKSGKPLMGICLGSQIVFDFSEEEDTECLGLIPGKVVQFEKKEGFKIPQIGWNTVSHSGHSLFSGLPQDISFYFVHSYHVVPESSDYVLATGEYGIPFTAAVQYENICATQFHPEKSGEWGLRLLNHFVNGQGE